MKYLLILLSISLFAQTNMKKIYTFSQQTNPNEWRIVNDGVMGGISNSSIQLIDNKYGQFSGHVSLENNGGFASIQLDISQPVEEKKHIVLRVKGDGKTYEFRLKGFSNQPESYVHSFNTTGEWENIKLPINQFYPQFRGRRLNLSNFNFKTIEQLSFLIANKQEEDFTLLIDWIALE